VLDRTGLRPTLVAYKRLVAGNGCRLDPAGWSQGRLSRPMFR
jgi:hypothetical protein